MTYRRNASRTTVDTSSPRASAVCLAAFQRSSGMRTLRAVVPRGMSAGLAEKEALPIDGGLKPVARVGVAVQLGDVPQGRLVGVVPGLAGGGVMKKVGRHVTSVPTPVPTLSTLRRDQV